jgi:hypothetical protein
MVRQFLKYLLKMQYLETKGAEKVIASQLLSIVDVCLICAVACEFTLTGGQQQHA